MKGEVLVDAYRFMENLVARIGAAKNRIYIQAMTFEYDSAGKKLIEALKNAGAPDIRLLIDDYSRHVINDRFIFSPRYIFSEPFRREAKDTRNLKHQLEDKGIQVRFTNPLSPFYLNYPYRNHKKIILIDDEISYLGGINFSDHNFAWHDMMLRIIDGPLNSELADDFLSTWESEDQSKVVQMEESELFLMDGYTSKSQYSDLFSTITGARKEIVMISPYVSQPLLGLLKSEVPDEVAIKLITPSQNNKSILQKMMHHECRNSRIKLYAYPGMSHLKAVFIDRKILIFGSSNYDFVSYFFEQEVILKTRNKTLINDFMHNVLKPDIEKSEVIKTPKKHYFSSFLITTLYRSLDWLYSNSVQE